MRNITDIRINQPGKITKLKSRKVTGRYNLPVNIPRGVIGVINQPFPLVVQFLSSNLIRTLVASVYQSFPVVEQKWIAKHYRVLAGVIAERLKVPTQSLSGSTVQLLYSTLRQEVEIAQSLADHFIAAIVNEFPELTSSPAWGNVIAADGAYVSGPQQVLELLIQELSTPAEVPFPFTRSPLFYTPGEFRDDSIIQLVEYMDDEMNVYILTGSDPDYFSRLPETVGTPKEALQIFRTDEMVYYEPMTADPILVVYGVGTVPVLSDPSVNAVYMGLEPPTSVSGTYDEANGEIDLLWSAVTGAEGYLVQYNGSSIEVVGTSTSVPVALGSTTVFSVSAFYTPAGSPKVYGDVRTTSVAAIPRLTLADLPSGDGYDFRATSGTNIASMRGIHADATLAGGTPTSSVDGIILNGSGNHVVLPSAFAAQTKYSWYAVLKLTGTNTYPYIFGNTADTGAELLFDGSTNKMYGVAAGAGGTSYPKAAAATPVGEWRVFAQVYETSVGGKGLQSLPGTGLTKEFDLANVGTLSSRSDFFLGKGNPSASTLPGVVGMIWISDDVHTDLEIETIYQYMKEQMSDNGIFIP